MSAPLTASAQKVQDALRALGLSSEVVESEQPTRTAAEAAKLVGCQVGQIAKSLVFKTAQTERAVLVITSGANTVNEFRVGMHVKEALGKAPAAFVRQVTGFAIGGIPPLAHATQIPTFIDQDLMKYPEIWAAAGTPNALFRLAPADLVKMTGGRVIRVT
ncbi:MAG: prolyl-tRNA editing protein [Candidatus Rokubacteria bacterium 13_1_40CM_68_15]|nr:MAG: prolyl-tRNA editing protein [Candidatus Rokubacteria bacterium 13_1_40CM_68_15]